MVRPQSAGSFGTETQIQATGLEKDVESATRLLEAATLAPIQELLPRSC